jgi:hypothetical protein
MARISWERKEKTDVLTAGRADGTGKDRVYSPFWRCSLSKMFPDFLKLTASQQMVVEYGVKQKLSDSIARPKEEKLSKQGVIGQFQETWDMILGGDWVKKVTPKTPLEKAIAEKESLQKDMAQAQEAMLAEGVQKKTVDSIVKKLFGESLTALSEKITKLEKENQ